jgi:hypothetical protein
MFTPTNITQNWVERIFGLNDKPKNTGIQWIKPAMIAKTAPMERT